MVIKKRRKFKVHHIYIATVVDTSVVCLAIVRFTNGGATALVFGGFVSTVLMIALVHLFDDRIDEERKNGEEDEGEN